MAVENWLAEAAGRRLSFWPDAKSAKRQHRPTENLGYYIPLYSTSRNVNGANRRPVVHALKSAVDWFVYVITGDAARVQRYVDGELAESHEVTTARARKHYKARKKGGYTR